MFLIPVSHFKISLFESPWSVPRVGNLPRAELCSSQQKFDLDPSALQKDLLHLLMQNSEKSQIPNFFFCRKNCEMQLPFQQTNRKSFDSITEILKISILHWICPVALDIQD